MEAQNIWVAFNQIFFKGFDENTNILRKPLKQDHDRTPSDYSLLLLSFLELRNLIQ